MPILKLQRSGYEKFSGYEKYCGINFRGLHFNIASNRNYFHKKPNHKQHSWQIVRK